MFQAVSGDIAEGQAEEGSIIDYIKPTDAQLKTTFYFLTKKTPDGELRFETYVGVQIFYKSYNKKWFLIVHQLV
jgi:hypothetical protein